MLKELVRKANLAQCSVDLCSSKVLTNACSNSTNANAVFKRNHKSVIGSHLHYGLWNRDNPARVHNCRADSLVCQHLRNLHSGFGHGANGEN
jgi:hypothetical protein